MSDAMMLMEPDWHDARAFAHASGVRLLVEQVAIAEADRRVLATDLHALTSLPPYDTSAMDGWAVAGDAPWRIVGDLRAGDLPTRALRAGECVGIATGTVLPEGCLGVLRSERSTMGLDGRIHGSVTAGQDIRRRGEECARGDVLVPAGTQLAPVHLGLAAAAGHEVVDVVRRARIRVLVCGDELLDGGSARDGKVRDSLGPQLPAWFDRWGAEVDAVQRVADTADALRTAMADAVEVDLVVTTGGTAAGPVDLVRGALATTGGRLLVDTVAVRPGHPMLLGTWDQPHRRWLIGLPGNPQAAVVALITLGLPLVTALNGEPLPPLERRTSTEAVSSHGAKVRLVPCASDGHSCTPTRHIGSGMLRGLAAADGYAVIPAGGVQAGDEVEWHPLPT